MREVKGYFREFQGKRIWIPEHEDQRAAAQPHQEPPKAPKNLKPINMPPPQVPGHLGAPKAKPYMQWGKSDKLPGHTTSEPFKNPDYGKPKQPKLPDSHYHSLGMLPPAQKEWPKLPELTPEEKLAKFLKNNPHAKLHPKKGEDGKDFYVKNPTYATGQDTWDDPLAAATFRPAGKAPAVINGVALAPWLDHPTTDDGWQAVDGQDDALLEPPMRGKMAPAAGVVIEEPDGRVWIVHPSNGFAGYDATFPKGHLDHGMESLQATAIKEAFEESGMKVEITGFLADVDRTATTTRYYTARRVGGTPADCGWETQGVSLVPRATLYHFLNSTKDHGLAEALGAGPAPLPPPKPVWDPPAKWSKPSKHYEADDHPPEEWWNDFPF